MDRLTFEGNFCDIAMCREISCPYNGMCSQRQTWERLKEFEDRVETPQILDRILDAYGRGMTLRTENAHRLEIFRQIPTEELEKIALAYNNLISSRGYSLRQREKLDFQGVAKSGTYRFTDAFRVLQRMEAE